MVSRNDLLIGVLVLIAGVVIYGAAPAGAGGGGFLYQPVVQGDFMAHNTTHFVGGGLAIVFGLVALAMYKKVGMVTVAVSVLSIILGLVFVLFAAKMPLFTVMQPHGVAMAATGGLTAFVGLVGVVAAVALKPKAKN